LNLSIDSFLAGNRLSLQPVNVDYANTNGSISIDGSNQISLYTMSIIFVGNMSSCVSSPSGTGDLDVEISVEGGSSSCTISESEIDMVDVDMVVDGESVSLIIDGDNGITLTGEVSGNITTMLTFSGLEEEPYFEIPIDLVFTEQVFNFSKKGQLLLLS